MRIHAMFSAGAVAILATLWSTPVQAQPIGTFTWQLQPFCNKVTVSVTQNGGVYTLDGFDDQCGAAQRAPLVGLATPNPDGTIGFGLHIVTVPGGRAVQVDARITLAALGGPWSDSAGNSGTFVLNGAAAGAARPAPTVSGAVLAVGSIPGTAIANGAVGNAQIATNAVSSSQTSNEPGIAGSFFDLPTVRLPLFGGSIATVSMRVPANGFVKVEVTGIMFQTDSSQAECQLQKGAATAPVDRGQPWFWLKHGSDGSGHAFSAHRIFSVASTDNPSSVLQGQVFRLVCGSPGVQSMRTVHMTATYYATDYSPVLFDTPPLPQ